MYGWNSRYLAVWVWVSGIRQTQKYRATSWQLFYTHETPYVILSHATVKTGIKLQAFVPNSLIRVFRKSSEALAYPEQPVQICCLIMPLYLAAVLKAIIADCLHSLDEPAFCVIYSGGPYRFYFGSTYRPFWLSINTEQIQWNLFYF